MSIPPRAKADRIPPFWSREHHLRRRPALLTRAKIAMGVRAYFAQRDFVEVEPAALQVSPGNETHLHGFRADLICGDGRAHPLYLHTSPEFAMKKLLAAGETRIFALSHVFRNRERSALHAPEFTMLEWYRADEPPAALERDCGALLMLAARTAGAETFRYRGRECDPFASPERVSVRQAFERHTGIDIFETIEAPLTPGPSPGPSPARGEGGKAFAAQATAIGVRTAADDSWSDVFSRLLSERVEPKLGLGRATILCDYPASEAALARVNARDARVAERFELYACGVELANAFGELTDAAEQRRRFEADMALKSRLYGEAYPIDEDFLAALERMPAASGAALGFDRLVMLATGVERIDEAQWTPVVDPEVAA